MQTCKRAYMRNIYPNDVCDQNIEETIREIISWDAKPGHGNITINAYALTKLVEVTIVILDKT